MEIEVVPTTLKFSLALGAFHMLGGCSAVVPYTAQSWKHDWGDVGMKK